MTYGTLILIFFIVCIVGGMILLIMKIRNEKEVKEDIDEGLNKQIQGSDGVVYSEVDGYDGYVDMDNQIYKLIAQNKAMKKLGKIEDTQKFNRLFDNAKNPWGMSPQIFQAIRIGGLIGGLILAALLTFLFRNWIYGCFGLLISAIAYIYPMYYYKAIAKEREEEWDKIYEFIWLFKHTSQMYDARKVCIECKNYIEAHYPQYQEIISGLQDFYDYWDDSKIPDYIIKYYNFPIPKELYNILFQMEITGVSPETNFSNLRTFALNKHEKKIQKSLGTVPSKATIMSLPFLMISVILGLMVPLLITFFQLF